ncbi:MULTISPECIES: hypothetical protein [Bacillaceae]|uniref:hypothetical protein n=1 Tax=Bacillaceae TaxID=186817 RepID=UPI000B9AD668|nr:hypothetical protein [Bacillus infantis]MCK6206079.1 hypothetical protein [Bacillus infantis]MDW2876576.1 hypothetical protein [Bacillus infantis]OXT16782.1 hypothetical protein B9K06_13910 [Bacillus sp. OG2]
MTQKAYLINTNRSGCPNGSDERDMLANAKCAAYFSPWKEKIKKLQEGDLVFLYSNKRGIIARGVATGIVQAADHGDEHELHLDEEFYMRLHDFDVLSFPMPAADIRQAAGYRMVFGQTLTPMKAQTGKTIWEEITKHYLKP